VEIPKLSAPDKEFGIGALGAGAIGKRSLILFDHGNSAEVETLQGFIRQNGIRADRDTESLVPVSQYVDDLRAWNRASGRASRW
jgi:hypothetical protein